MLLLLSALLTLLTGCGPRVRGPADSSPIVRSVSFQGNGGAFSGTGDFTLRAAMVQRVSPTGWWLAPRQRAVHLEADTLKADAYRIENWYAHHGFFDAQFLGWEVVTSQPRRLRAPVVTLVGHVDEGPPSTVGEVKWVGMEAIVGPLLSLLNRQRPLQEGARFNVADSDATKDLAVSRLREQSFAAATLTAEINARADDHLVDVTYRGDPGPPYRFGDVSIVTEGLRVPEDLIRDEITIEPCKPYKGSEIASTQRALFGLGTFSFVNVVPVLAEPRADGACGEDVGEPVYLAPIQIELKESSFRQMRLGGGVAIENGKQDVHATIDFRHSNLGNRLWRLSAGATGGYTWLIGFDELSARLAPGVDRSALEPVAGAPVLDLSLGLTVPRFFARRLRLENELTLGIGVEEEYQYVSPEVSTGLSWSINRQWTLAGGVHVLYFNYFNLTVDLAALAAEQPGIDISDPYVLAYLSQSLLYDSRNDPLFTTSGAYASVRLAEAGPPGQYDYFRVEAEERLYRRIRIFGWRPRGASWAGRVGGGAILPSDLIDESRESVPYDERLRLGGSTSVRGWGDKHLGPYVYACGADGTELCSSSPQVAICDSAKDCAVDTTPIGGLYSAYGGLELRAYWADTYGLVAFTDIGMVWSTFDEIALVSPVPSVGLGGRYKTPVGPLRLDVAMPLFRPPMLQHEPRVQAYLSLSEAF